MVQMFSWLKVLFSLFLLLLRKQVLKTWKEIINSNRQIAVSLNSLNELYQSCANVSYLF